MTPLDREAFADAFEEQCIAHDCEARPGRPAIYERGLREFSFSVVQEAGRDLQRTCKRFPTLAEWVERCKAIVVQRARSAPARESAEPAGPVTWSATANVMLAFAAIAGVKVSDAVKRARALELVNDELRAGLREEFTQPSDVPRARLVDERRRIVGLLVRELAGDVSAAEHAL